MRKMLSMVMALAMLAAFAPQASYAEDGMIRAEVTLIADGKTMLEQSVSVAEYPVKDYIPSETGDPLEGKASVYDALLAAAGEQNLSAGWDNTYSGVYLTGITIDGISYQAKADEPVIKGEYGTEGYYSKYSGAGWTYSIDGKTGTGMSGQQLTEGAQIVVTYAPYCYEDGAYQVSVRFVTPNGASDTDTVFVPICPEKDYVLSDSNPNGIADKLEGNASAYDALLQAAGKEKVRASGTYLTGITIGETAYDSVSDTPKLLCDSAFYYSSGKDWTYTVNGIMAEEYLPDQKIEYGDALVFTYSPWQYVMDMYTFAGVSMPYGIGGIMDADGGFVSHDFTGVTEVYVTATSFDENAPAADVWIAAYDKNGVMLDISKTYMGTQKKLKETEAPLNLPQGTHAVKAFVWDEGCQPAGGMRSDEQEEAA